MVTYPLSNTCECGGKNVNSSCESLLLCVQNVIQLCFPFTFIQKKVTGVGGLQMRQTAQSNGITTNWCLRLHTELTVYVFVMLFEATCVYSSRFFFCITKNLMLSAC